MTYRKFGNLLVANVKDTGAQAEALTKQAEALNKLVHHQTASWARLDQLLQIELLNAWSDELAKPRHADPKRLVRYGFKVYSQCDEDGIIQEIFRRIGTTNRVFVEFGVESAANAIPSSFSWKGGAACGSRACRNTANKFLRGFGHSWTSAVWR